MTKEEIIEIAQGLGFYMNFDQFDNRGFIRFQLKEELDEKEFRWIWYKEIELIENLNRGAQILFKAGQKAFKLNLNKYIEL
jgi:hypothetical protein